MNLKLTRFLVNEYGAFGKLYDENDQEICVTLEHAYLGIMKGFSPKLPAGTYTCRLGPHKLEKMTTYFNTYEITNVPGHTNILFHVGNYNSDSEGCVLVGTVLFPDETSPTMIKQSSIAFTKLIALQDGADTFTLEVT
jgi:Family of unknown function (DUF5675)